jgi:hypothetical protein
MILGSPYYQQLKVYIVAMLHLAADAIHIYIGFFCLVATTIFLKKRMPGFLMLIPGFLFSIFMEVMDLTYQARVLGAPDWNDSWHDILNTNLLPLLVVIFFHAVSPQKEIESKTTSQL